MPGAFTPADAEARLVERAKREPQAFGELYEKYYGAILNYTFRQTLDVATAEELTSSTLFKALKALPRYKPRRPFRAWLYRIATNEVRMRWRRLRRPASQPERLSESTLKRLHFSEKDIEQPEQVIEKMTTYLRLYECMSLLPRKYHTALALRYLEELPIAEIAVAMGKREGTVKSIIHRGLKRLRRHMEERGATSA